MSCKKFRRKLDRHLNKNPLSNMGRDILANLPMSVGFSFNDIINRMVLNDINLEDEKAVAEHLIRLIEAGYVEVV